jgi:GMP synthase (glutamine-hydrolysing)
MQHDKVLVLDFGSQYSQIITRRIRECKVFAEMHAGDWELAKIKAFQPKAIILSGGPESVTVHDTIRVDPAIYDLGIPVLGICYGMQMMAQQLGGSVASAEISEFGRAHLQVVSNDSFAKVFHDESQVWMSHGDYVAKAPPGFAVFALTIDCPIAFMANNAKKLYGVQFHPEVAHTPAGMDFFRYFLEYIACCVADWDQASILEEHIATIKDQVGAEKVLLGLSGGVDSSVVAALLHKAIGDKLVCVFVDTGLLRLNEGDQVMQTFAANMGIKVIRVNAADLFMQALAGLDDPEAKRKAIGRLFITIFDTEAKKLSGIKFLAQGTIYSDVIESADTKHGKAHVIKSHHNVGGLPDDLQFKLVEPLRDLFKDEVRQLGLKLGLPYEMLYRHPFPGPGLAVRILGEVKAEYVTILQQVDNIFMQALYEHNIYHQLSQAFAVFLPVKSVGVKGDQRAYGYVVALRAVVTEDFMTATWAKLAPEILSRVSDKIVGSVHEVVRVVYDITSKPPATIEWE